MGPTSPRGGGGLARRPAARIIAFAKGAGLQLKSYRQETRADAIGLDWSVPLSFAAELQKDGPVQGNLDPLLLLAGGSELERRARYILDCFADRPHVFNLGHGIGQYTPVEHVEQLLAVVRGWRH